MEGGAGVGSGELNIYKGYLINDFIKSQPHRDYGF